MAYANFTTVYLANRNTEAVQKIEYCTNTQGNGLFVWSSRGMPKQLVGTADFTYRNRRHLLNFLNSDCTDSRKFFYSELEAFTFAGIKKYSASYSANNGTTYNRQPYYSNNKNKLKKDIIAICKGNIFWGNSGSWSIYDYHHGNPIDAGQINISRSGKVSHISHDPFGGF